MKSSFKIIFNLLFVLFIFSCTKNPEIFKENNDLKHAESELKNALINNEILPDKVIPDSQTAVDVAENFLFNIYGKENIIQQRPYNLNFIDDYYIIEGTLPKNTLGGTFLIIINSKDGKIIKLTHGK
ncbi:YbbC/YhhH family protein [Chryseobacterium sp. NKUCC03_KSP]|uniref:YbbC/YhhH family protein n=1 Tax=Chryseobacterium sp. NKUCC03_KSP TaxID=2842125 RepID=UPI001C5BBDB0|nr:YbbC/YhhH family protein [Chryseobacterium sp. NKUCC03_KSP]MBW3521021.1 YbbC/YhhH family protein [Chryseobacterium sp. NKUCC03_KSP]